MKKIMDHLTKTNPDRLEGFKKAVQPAVKKVSRDNCEHLTKYIQTEKRDTCNEIHNQLLYVEHIMLTK